MYIGLFVGFTEPDPSTGYARVEGDLSQTIVFPPSRGYGAITHIGVFGENGGLVNRLPLPEPVDCHDGVIPFIHEGRLFRGVDVTAKVVAGTKAQIKA